MPTEMVPGEAVVLLKLHFLGHQEGRALGQHGDGELVCDGCSVSIGEDEKLLEMVVMAAQ